MNWDRIRAEGVHGNHLVLVIWGLSQLEPGIAQDDVIGSLTVQQVGKIGRVSRNSDHGRINIVKGDMLPRPAVAGQGAGTKSNHGQVLSRQLLVQDPEKLPNRP